MPDHAVQCHTMPYHAKPYHATPYHAIPYHIIPCYTIPCHAMSDLTRMQRVAIRAQVQEYTKHETLNPRDMQRESWT